MQKQGTSRTPGDGYLKNGFQVFFDANERVEFIELCKERWFGCTLFGLPILRTPASDVISELSSRFAFDPTRREFGYMFIFTRIELGLWRPVIPKSDKDRSGRFFATVGIGVSGYYSEGRF